uniref:BTB domain-containing protein n=1 Tax=Knipowitschia caucasica TaxID=637954 RepID=A0AAV2KCI5_KNICA
MASVSGGDRKRAPSKEPELSLSWCISKLQRKPQKELERRARQAQWRALVAIRTQHIKGHRGSLSRFRMEGGLSSLLLLLKQSDCSSKTLDLGLSILANCCTERESCVQVRKLDGIRIIVDILRRQGTLLSVQNRAARALGNLAMDPQNSDLIHTAGAVPLLLSCISQALSPPSSGSSPSGHSALDTPPPSDSALSSPGLQCAQSCSRALLYLCDSAAHRLSLLSLGTVCSLAPLLAPPLPLPLRRAAVRALHELTRSCTAECARQLVRSGALEQLGALACGTGEEACGGGEVACGTGEEACGGREEQEVREAALKTLANLCAQGCLRPLVGSLGVIRRFCEEVKQDLLKSSLFLRALCLCCKEAVNRVKVKECGGLELLTWFLSEHQDHQLTRLAISACVDFVFDEVAMETLQEAGLVQVLVQRLVRACKDRSITPPADTARDCSTSFDFPAPEEKKGALCSSSFLSLRSWLLSEGLISSEGDLLESSSTTETDWSTLQLPTPPANNTAAAATTATTLITTTAATTSSAATSATGSSSPIPVPPSPLSSSTPKAASSSAPPAAKSPVSPSKFRLCSPQRRGSRERPPLLRLSIQTPPSASASRPPPYHPYHPEPWTAESPILLLLSRFSHVPDPAAALGSAAVLWGLLTYVSEHPDPSARCFRLLLRLSLNPNCLHALVRSGAAAMVQLRLCRGEREEPTQRPREGEEPTQRPREGEEPTQRPREGEEPTQRPREGEEPTQRPREGEEPKQRPREGDEPTQRPREGDEPTQCPREGEEPTQRPREGEEPTQRPREGEEPTQRPREGEEPTQRPREGEEPLQRPREGEDPTQSPHIRAKVRQLGLTLLSNLQLQCEGTFGAGVLSHLLLSGPESDRLNSALCLPLLTSNKSLLKKLLLDGGGLLLALQPLGGDTDWDQPPPPSPQCPLRALYLPLLATCLSALTALSAARICPDAPPSPDAKKPRPLPCCYEDCMHDVTFLLDNGETLSANRVAVSGEQSQYFRALLSGTFREANADVVRIRDVTAAELLPVLHQLHGCRLSSHYCALHLTTEEEARFLHSRLCAAMTGACRFLADGLRFDLEQLCVARLEALTQREVSDCVRSTGVCLNSKTRKRKCAGAALHCGDGRLWPQLPQIYCFSQRLQKD